MLVPTAFVAETLNLYSCPVKRPVAVNDGLVVVPASRYAPAGPELIYTEYERIGVPPLSGATHSIAISV